jgi:hypothetical protein
MFMEQPEGNKWLKDIVVGGRLILKKISLFCSVTTIRNMDTPYIRHNQVQYLNCLHTLVLVCWYSYTCQCLHIEILVFSNT